MTFIVRAKGYYMAVLDTPEEVGEYLASLNCKAIGPQGKQGTWGTFLEEGQEKSFKLDGDTSILRKHPSTQKYFKAPVKKKTKPIPQKKPQGAPKSPQKPSKPKDSISARLMRGEPVEAYRPPR